MRHPIDQRSSIGRSQSGSRFSENAASPSLAAAVVRAVPEAWKRRLGSTSYALWAVKLLLRYRPTEVALAIDGESISAELFWLLLGNTRSYGGIVNVTSEALVDDGHLDAYLFQGHGYAWEARTALKLAMRRHHGGRGVSFHRLQQLTIETPGLPVQADGEYIGQTPVTFSVEPQALDVLLPADRGRELFGSES